MTTSPASQPLRMATFNIRNGIALDGLDSWPFRRRAAADAVARLDADVIALQEAYGFQEQYLLRRLPGYRATGAGRTDGHERGERCAVLYRTDRVALEASLTRWFSETPDVPGSTGWGSTTPRIATFARFRDLQSGRAFGFVDCHLEGWPRLARQRSADLLLSWLEPGLPWVVAGDLNAEPTDWAVQTLLAAGLHDVFGSVASMTDSQVGLEGQTGAQSVAGVVAGVVADAGTGGGPGGSVGDVAQRVRAGAAAPPTTTGGFDGRDRPRRIDYIFVTDGWQVIEAAVAADSRHRRLPSDHWPVVATLLLS